MSLMKYSVVALILATTVPAFAASDDEPPPKLLSFDEAREARLATLARREGVAAASLLSAGGMLELGGLASFLAVILGGHSDGCVNGGCGPNRVQAGMLEGASVSIFVMGSVGTAALIAGTVLAVTARRHSDRARGRLMSSSLSWTF